MNKGGYPLNWFIYEPTSDLICNSCSKVLNDPQSCTEGHTCCKSCVSEIGGCPVSVCGENAESEVSFTVSNKLIKNQVKLLKVKCKCKLLCVDVYNSPCQWIGLLSERDAVECEHELLDCPNDTCQKLVPRNQMPSHLAERCLACMVRCPLFDLRKCSSDCTGFVPKDRLKDHLRPHRNELQLASRLVERLLTASGPNKPVSSASSFRAPSSPAQQPKQPSLPSSSPVKRASSVPRLRGDYSSINNISVFAQRMSSAVALSPSPKNTPNRSIRNASPAAKGSPMKKTAVVSVVTAKSGPAGIVA